MARTAHQMQLDFAQSSGLRSEIIWDSLSPEQSDVLKIKIANLICVSDSKNAKAIEKQRQVLFENVWKQRIYTNGTLLSSTIYVLVSAEQESQLALASTSYSCHPVIRTRKCMRGADECSLGCCMVFVDEYGRVYGSWEKYVRNNALPKGTMIAPEKGVYTFNTDNDVQLMVQSTPSSWLKQKLLSAGDRLATVGGLVGYAPIVASMALPIAAPLLMAATAVGVGTSAYSTLRSASRLIDRRWHGQSNSLRDSDARKSWLGMAHGVVGLGASGATKALGVLRPEAHLATHLAIKGINASAVVVNGTGMLNGVYDMYLKVSDEQPLTSSDMIQIAASLLIFTHSVNNLRMASKINSGYSLRRAVSHQSKKVFDRISQRMHNNNNNNSSTADKWPKFDIVRTLNDIPYKDVLLSMHTIHTHLAQSAALLGAVSAAGLLPSFISLNEGGELRLDVELLGSKFGCKFVQHIGNFGSFMDVLDGMSKYFSEQAVSLLMQLARNFVDQHVDSIDRTLNTFVSTELVLYRMLMHCVNSYEQFAVDFLQEHRQEIMNITSKYFESLQPKPTSEQSCRKRKCPYCHGVFYISTL